MTHPAERNADAHAGLIRAFYAAFQARDHRTMAECYAPDAMFTDPVFGQLVGRRAYGLHAEQQVAMTERFVRELTATGDWKLVTPVDTAIAAVRYVGRTDGQTARRPTAETDAMQDRIVQRVLATRRHWISPTTTVGTRAIRVMVISYLTEWHHLEELLAAMRSAAAEEA